MNKERESIAVYLRELLEWVENENSNILQEDLYWLRRFRLDDEIALRLSNIERRLESLEPTWCSIAGSGNAQAVHLITGLHGKFGEEKKHISSWLSDTRHLIIVDPYFYSFNKANKIHRTPTQYLEFVTNLLPKRLKSIEIFHLPGPNQLIRSGIQNHCHKKNIYLRNWATAEVHDRVLIKDENEAKVLGTSFGGLGNKIAFVLDLPQVDLAMFKRELNRIKSGVPTE